MNRQVSPYTIMRVAVERYDLTIDGAIKKGLSPLAGISEIFDRHNRALEMGVNFNETFLNGTFDKYQSILFQLGVMMDNEDDRRIVEQTHLDSNRWVRELDLMLQNKSLENMQ